MKLQGFLKGVGKIENLVISQMGGVTVARAYQPNVKNPSTMLQVNQRARLKLASQLAAALAPIIAIAKQGLVSGRNQFIKNNMGAVTADSGVAQISYENIQVTNGTVGLPGISAKRADGNITVQLSAAADAAISQVVFIIYKKNEENVLIPAAYSSLCKLRTTQNKSGLTGSNYSAETASTCKLCYPCV